MAARARVKISDGVHPPLRRVRNENFLSARAPSSRVSTLDSTLEGGRWWHRELGERRRKREERKKCEMAAAAKISEAGSEKVVGGGNLQEGRD